MDCKFVEYRRRTIRNEWDYSFQSGNTHHLENTYRSNYPVLSRYNGYN